MRPSCGTKPFRVITNKFKASEMRKPCSASLFASPQAAPFKLPVSTTYKFNSNSISTTNKNVNAKSLPFQVVKKMVR